MKRKSKTGPSEAARAPGAVTALAQGYNDLAEQRRIDIHTILSQDQTIKQMSAEMWAQDWFTIAPKYRTKERLIKMFRAALRQSTGL